MEMEPGSWDRCTYNGLKYTYQPRDLNKKDQFVSLSPGHRYK